jgi:hypothetical protein
MHALKVVADAGAYMFLTSLLELERADSNVEFVNLRIEHHLTVFDRMRRTPRTTRYADEQKARRCRIALAELRTYFQKKNRNSYIISSAASDELLTQAVAVLKADATATAKLDKALFAAVTDDARTTDAAFRSLVRQVPTSPRPAFLYAQSLLRRHMDAIAELLSAHWEAERYVRDLDTDIDDDLQTIKIRR